MADKFVLKTPKGELVKVRTPNGEVKMEIRSESEFWTRYDTENQQYAGIY